MKAILSMALVLGVCGLAGAADKVEPVGTWKCEYQIGDQKWTLELTIKKDGDNLVGTMSWSDQKDEKLDGKSAAVFRGQKQEYDIEGKREKKDK